MSLQQAAAWLPQRDNDPLNRGLSAGQAAYRNIGQSPLGQSVGQGLSQAAAQRQVLTDNAAKQAAGRYGNTGTSAAAYEYLHGKGKYPVNPLPGYIPLPGTSLYKGLPPTASGTPTSPVAGGATSAVGAPIQKPYEQATNVGPTTQTSLANAAKTSPTKMGARPTPPGIAKPSTMNQLLATLGPMYLGYSLLDKSGIVGGIGNLYNNFMYPGVYGAEGNFISPSVADYFANTAATNAATDAALIDTANSIGAGATTTTPATVDVSQGLPPEVTDPNLNPYATSGPAVDVASTDPTIPESVTGGAASADAASDAAAAAAAEQAAGAGAASSVDYVNAMDAASDAAAAAAASEAELASAQATAEAAGLDWAAMSAEYGPYVAAAIIADQVLLDGKISSELGRFVKGAGDVVEDVVDTVGDTGQDILDTGTDLAEDTWETLTGGCFMTTAAVDHAGEEDDGKTLTAMRELRDNYLKKMPEGRKEIEWYYRKAPKIVAAIDKKPNAHAIYMRMYNDHLKPTARAVDAGKMELAHQRYNKMIGFAKKVSGLSTKELEAKTKQGIPKDIKKHFAEGGATGLPQVSHLGGYSDGGRLLKGPGDGVSDSIPAVIGNKQPARLADGEFVVPARIVSELGNGSTEAGARKLYAMMERIQKGRKKSIGKGKVAVNSRADKHLPA